jgi:hypothetical protein
MLDPRTSRMITATPSVYKPARQQRLVLTCRNTSRIPKNFPYFTTSNTARHHNPTSHILWPVSPVVRLQRLHTCGHNPCQFPISKVCTRDALSICALAVHLYLRNHITSRFLWRSEDNSSSSNRSLTGSVGLLAETTLTDLRLQ